MAAHNELGKRGEDLAVRMLRDKGYKILERNWRLNDFEVDIIAKSKNEIVFVEVKTRSDDSVLPEQAVDKRRQVRLVSAANAYVRHNAIDLDVRFDVVAIVLNDVKCEVIHFEDAFLAPMS